MCGIAGFFAVTSPPPGDPRATLQRMLALFTPALPGLQRAHRGIVRWAIDVDPLGI